MKNGCSGQIEVVSAGSKSKVVTDWEYGYHGKYCMQQNIVGREREREKHHHQMVWFWVDGSIQGYP